MIVEKLLRLALLGSTWVMYLLIALSVVSIGATIERMWFFRKHQDDIKRLRRKVHEHLANDELFEADELLAKSPSIEAKVIRAGLRWWEGGPEVFAEVVASEMEQIRGELERGMTLLGTLGNNAPFVGLLGTVIGVIEAFHQLGDTSNKNAMGNVMAGIAEALVATGVGLFVALPAVVAFNWAQGRIGKIEGNVTSFSTLVQAIIRYREREDAAHNRLHAPMPAKEDILDELEHEHIFIEVHDSHPRPEHKRTKSPVGNLEIASLAMAGTMASGKGKRGGIVGINVTPMVDVVLVLLVIMMVSATYIVSQSLKVELPKTATSDESVTSVAAVTLTKDGKLYFNQEPCDEASLPGKFRAAQSGGTEVNLIVTADEAVTHGRVVHVIDLAKVEGITKFAINVERSK